jgi:hypothetical protein
MYLYYIIFLNFNIINIEIINKLNTTIAISIKLLFVVVGAGVVVNLVNSLVVVGCISIGFIVVCCIVVGCIVFVGCVVVGTCCGIDDFGGAVVCVVEIRHLLTSLLIFICVLFANLQPDKKFF